MAIEQIISVKAELKSAEKSFQDLGATIQEQKDITIEFEKELLRLQQQLKEVSNVTGSLSSKEALQLIDKQKQLRSQIDHVKTAITEQRIVIKDLNNEKAKTVQVDDDQLKGLNRTQGVIGVLNRLTGGLAGELLNVAKAAKLSGAAMKTALISSGIGAAVIAIGLIADNWEAIVGFIKGSNESLEEQHDVMESNIGVLDSQLDILKKENEYNKDRGISNEENLKKQKEILAEKKKLLLLDIELLTAQLEKEKSAASELSLWQKFQLALGNVPDLTLISPEEQQRINDLEKQINNLRSGVIGVDNAVFDIDNPNQNKSGDKREKLKAIDAGLSTEEQAARLEKEQQFFEETFNLKQEQQQALIDSANEANQEIADNEAVINAQRYLDNKRTSELIQEIAMLEAQAKTEQLWLYSDALAAVGDLVGKQTTAGKALSVASTLISTYLSAQKAYESQLTLPTPDAPVRAALAAGVAILSGLANVKAILSVKTPGGGGAGNSTGGVSQQRPPSFNVVGTSGTNQIAQGLSQQQQPIQAYVVGSNVTSQQALDRNIIETATIG